MHELVLLRPTIGAVRDLPQCAHGVVQFSLHPFEVSGGLPCGVQTLNEILLNVAFNRGAAKLPESVTKPLDEVAVVKFPVKVIRSGSGCVAILPDHSVFALRGRKEINRILHRWPVILHSFQNQGVVEDPVGKELVDAVVAGNRRYRAILIPAHHGPQNGFNQTLVNAAFVTHFGGAIYAEGHFRSGSSIGLQEPCRVAAQCSTDDKRHLRRGRNTHVFPARSILNYESPVGCIAGRYVQFDGIERSSHSLFESIEGKLHDCSDCRIGLAARD
jgi:hypothetical protein